MRISMDGRGCEAPSESPTQVLCASCGSRFEAHGATTGARVRCPLCREVVQVAERMAERRRIARTLADAPRDVRRLASTQTRRVFRTLLLVATAAVAALALWHWRDELFRDAGPPPAAAAPR
jgi:hypothetical protein